jgi:hypothetical protein
VDERSFSVSDAANFTEAAFGVESSRSRVRIERVKADRIGGPGTRLSDRFFDKQPSHSLTLYCGQHSHAIKYSGIFTGVK